MNSYNIDLALRPTTFDLWHLCLAGTVLVLLFVLLISWISLFIVSRRAKKVAAIQPPAPEIKIVEKIVEVEKVVEVEKIIQAPAPEPVILKQATSDAALQLLNILQKEARFIDFIKEDMGVHADADIGAAARIVHQGCAKAINEHFKLAPVSQDQEGSKVTLNAGFDASAFRLTGNIVGQAPFTGSLVHKGWQVTEVNLPKLTEGHNPNIIVAAEVEL